MSTECGGTVHTWGGTFKIEDDDDDDDDNEDDKQQRYSLLSHQLCMCHLRQQLGIYIHGKNKRKKKKQLMV